MFAVTELTSGPLSGDPSEVELHDSPEDITHLLRALLPRMNTTKQENSGKKIYTFSQLSALIRLAHKYQIDDIQDEALSVLKTRFAYSLTNSWCDGEKAFDVPDPACAIEVIHIAGLTDTPALLPFAFYMCATIGGKTVEGWRREDGTMVYLSQEDLKTFIDGSVRLARKAEEVVTSVADIVRVRAGTSCPPSTGQQCRSSMSAVHRGFLASRRDELPNTPFCWYDTVAGLVRQHPCCLSCSASVLSGVLVRCAVPLWFRLPGIFGLPTQALEDLITTLL
ncbi:hypothetical protein C8T65DRAFT_826237 [Cerioporus squamosus]|nr:hypothetical protein C8T65DRAFT_837480 [Cerioporus squamosus]KAI0720779.1 hypothetical protein C8T65DRAFT_826237 [Cerioporus squamosus]